MRFWSTEVCRPELELPTLFPFDDLPLDDTPLDDLLFDDTPFDDLPVEDLAFEELPLTAELFTGLEPRLTTRLELEDFFWTVRLAGALLEVVVFFDVAVRELPLDEVTALPLDFERFSTDSLFPSSDFFRP